MDKFIFNKKYESSIVGKAIEQNIKNFSTEEILRVYKNCVNPSFCVKAFNILIERGLKYDHLINRNFKYNF